MTTVIWEGADEFARFLRDTPGIVARDVEAALYQEGENIMGKSIRRTPVDTGRLRSTGHVKLPRTLRGVTEVVLAYGTDYAVFVHEIMSNYHKVGTAKFLETAVIANATNFTNRMRLRVLNRIGRRR